jgi:anti-sigma factor RsiW
VSCEFADAVHGYFDGELGAPNAVEFERHLQHCVHCASELVDLNLLSDRLQLAQLYEPATPSLRRSLKAGIRPIAPTMGASPLLWHWLAAAAALFFVAIVLWRVSPGLGSGDYQAELAEQIVNAHVRFQQFGNTNGIASNDERVVKTWLDRSAGFVVPVRDFANEGFALKGGRLAFIEGQVVAVLAYQHNRRPISVFIWRTREQDSAPRPGSRQSLQWVDWRKGRMEFCAVSDTDPADLQQLQQLMNAPV